METSAEIKTTRDATRRMALKCFGAGLILTGTPLPLWGARTDQRRSWDGFATPPIWHPIEVATGDTLIVPAKVSGVAIDAVLDSGSGVSIVSKLLAARLGMTDIEPRRIEVRCIALARYVIARFHNRLPSYFTIKAD